MWHTVRVTWNDPGATTPETERAFVMGASFVGTPSFTYGRTHYGAWGCTSINPDVQDLYEETLKDNKYLYDGQWHDLEVTRELIPVRFGKPVVMYVAMTRNGVLIDRSFISGTAGDMVPFMA